MSLGRLVRLRTSLEQAADALAAADLAALLTSELSIEEALADLPALSATDVHERAEMRAELERVRAALIRCRRLGTAMSAFVRVSLDAQGRHAGYGDHGWTAGARTVDARV